MWNTGKARMRQSIMNPLCLDFKCAWEVDLEIQESKTLFVMSRLHGREMLVWPKPDVIVRARNKESVKNRI